MKKSSREFQEAGLDFRYGILTLDETGEKVDLITPEGERLRLNPRLNRLPLVHLHQQAVRVLIRKNPWPKLTANWDQYDILYVERLVEPLAQDELNESLDFSEMPSAEEIRSLIYAS